MGEGAGGGGRGWGHVGTFQDGSASFAAVETENVVLTALKTAEDGGDLIFRLVEYDGIDTDAVVTLDETLLGGRTSAVLCDLMETPIPGAPPCSIASGKVTLPVRANSIATVRVGESR